MATGGGLHLARLPAADGPFCERGTQHARPTRTHLNTFANQFWRLWASKQFKFPALKDGCYMFELLSSRHTRPLVSQNTTDDLVPIGAHCLVTLRELHLADVVAATG